MNNKVQMILLCKPVMFRWTSRAFRWTNKLVFRGVRYDIRRMYEAKGIDSETTRINIVSIKIHAINISHHNIFPSWWRDANGKKGIHLPVWQWHMWIFNQPLSQNIYLNQNVLHFTQFIVLHLINLVFTESKQEPGQVVSWLRNQTGKHKILLWDTAGWSQRPSIENSTSDEHISVNMSYLPADGTHKRTTWFRVPIKATSKLIASTCLKTYESTKTLSIYSPDYIYIFPTSKIRNKNTFQTKKTKDWD